MLQHAVRKRDLSLVLKLRCVEVSARLLADANQRLPAFRVADLQSRDLPDFEKLTLREHREQYRFSYADTERLVHLLHIPPVVKGNSG